MTYAKVDANLYLIPLDQKQVGFRNFISGWLYKSREITFLVDPGPTSSIKQLIDALKTIGVPRLDYILLTHIHIDHAGGTGALSRYYPEAKVICHPKAIDPMVSPKKLWQASLKILGDIAESYGEIMPVSDKAIGFLNPIKTETGDIKVYETPGHAMHHLCFQFDKYLFAGEVAGINHRLKKDVYYARPATPPRFKLKTSVSSLDRIIPLDSDMICFGHYGYRTDVKPVLKEARNQLCLWVETVKDQMEMGEKNLKDRIITTLKKVDPLFANVKYLPEDIQKRENYFIGNTINGMRAYLLEKSDNEC